MTELEIQQQTRIAALEEALRYQLNYILKIRYPANAKLVEEVLASLLIPVSEWQPIETAPKDGSLFLVWDACFTGYKVIYWKEPKDGYAGGWYPGGTQIYGNDKWMPLPKPPKEIALLKAEESNG